MAQGRKTGGRQKGALNKATAAAKAVALAFIERRTPEEIDGLWAAAKEESPAKAFGMWLGSLEFVIPKLARTEHTGEDGEPIKASLKVTFVRPAGS